MKAKKLISAILSVAIAASALGSTAITASAASYQDYANTITFAVSNAGNKPVKNAKYLLVEKDGGIPLGYFTYTGSLCGKGIYSFSYRNIQGKSNKGKTLKKGTDYIIVCAETPDCGVPLMLDIKTKNSLSNTYVEAVEAKWGDLDYDGAVTSKDVDILQKALNNDLLYTMKYGHWEYRSGAKVWVDDFYDEAIETNTIPTIPYLSFLEHESYVAWDFYKKAVKPNATVKDFVTKYHRGISTVGLYSYADVNCDRKINSADLALMQKYVNGWNVKLGKSVANDYLNLIALD